jgi:hypothetical protein
MLTIGSNEKSAVTPVRLLLRTMGEVRGRAPDDLQALASARRSSSLGDDHRGALDRDEPHQSPVRCSAGPPGGRRARARQRVLRSATILGVRLLVADLVARPLILGTATPGAPDPDAP